MQHQNAQEVFGKDKFVCKLFIKGERKMKKILLCGFFYTYIFGQVCDDASGWCYEGTTQ